MVYVESDWWWYMTMVYVDLDWWLYMAMVYVESDWWLYMAATIDMVGVVVYGSGD